MNKKIIVVVVVLVLMGITVGAFALTNPYWESEFELGTWGQKIVLTYADGTEQPLKSLFDNPFLNAYYGSNEISSIKYYLDGKAEGAGYTNVQVDVEDYKWTYQMEQGGVVKHSDVVQASTYYPNPIRNLAVDGSWHSLVGVVTTVTHIVPDTLPDGTYTLKIIPGGTLRYNPDNEGWQSATLPSTVSLTVTVESGGGLTIYFKSSYDVN